MFLRILLLLTLVPLTELYVLISVHDWLSQDLGSGKALMLTMGLILLTGVVGAALAKTQGFKVIQQVQQAMQRGELPSDALIDGVFVLIGGALLLTPGFLTDIFGFTCLFPLTRPLLRERFKVWMQTLNNSGHFVVYSSPRPGRPDAIDVEFEEQNSKT